MYMQNMRDSSTDIFGGQFSEIRLILLSPSQKFQKAIQALKPRYTI